jgi:hypothetical protein
MPERKTMERAAAAKRQGKAPSTQAGAFVKEEIDHVREGKHGVKSTRQAVAIGLSKARRAGVDLKPPKAGKASEATRRKAKADIEAGQGKRRKRASTESQATRSRATTAVLKKESRAPASQRAVSKQAHAAASRRSATDRSAAAKKAVSTKGAAGRSAAAKKAAQTRASRAAHHTHR